ncbi:polysaccharide deacetylase family protein, partial [Lysinibacillus telephonicus]
NNFANITTTSQMKKDDLYKKIQMFNEQHKIKPIDAKIDRVWKAIPGYNGLEVNIEASYKKMKKDGKFNKNKIVYKEIPPNIHLEDLNSEPIYRGNPQKPMVAFLINVAWGNEYIPGILKVLKEHKIKATFFLDGSWTKKNPDLAKMIKEAGHEIGNHAYSHPDLQQRSMAETTEELKKTNDVIEEILGIKPKWFAPPSGSFNKTTIQVAEQLNMKTILWTVDTVDWRKPSTSEMVSRIVSKVENGSMVLMHPTKPTAEGMEAMITGIKEKGYQLGTVSELMSEKRID